MPGNDVRPPVCMVSFDCICGVVWCRRGCYSGRLGGGMEGGGGGGLNPVGEFPCRQGSGIKAY